MSHSQDPFFLIGAERSGTTLLRLMMDHHPEIRFQFESNFLVDYLGPHGEDPDPEWVQKQLNLDRGAQLCGFQAGNAKGFKEKLRAFLQDDAKKAGKAIYGAAIHRRFAHLLHVWPQARFIHLIRDPRDVASSVIKMGWAGNSWHASEFWVEAQKEAEALLASLPANRWLQIHFEDLVGEPEKTLTEICSFLGCSFHPSMLRYPEDTSYPPPNASAAQRWKAILSPRQVQYVECRVGPQLEKAGYPPSGLSAYSPGFFRRSWLQLQNRWSKFCFKARRYGWWNTLGYLFSKKIGWKSMATRFLLKIHARENELLR